MSPEAWSRLEASLIARKVPRALWPRYFEKEEYRLLRRQIADDDEYWRRVSRKLEDDRNERLRRDAFATFVMLLAWLLALQERQRMDCRSFIRTAVPVLADTDHAKMLGGDTISNAAAAAALLSFPEQEVREALVDAIPGGMRRQINYLDGLGIESLEPQSLEDLEREQQQEQAEQAEADPDVMAPEF